MLEHVVVEASSPYSESYVDWMLHCWSVSWFKLMLAAWSRRVERVRWLRLNRVLELWTKWTDWVIVAKVCMRGRASESVRLGLCCAPSCADISETVAKALPRHSCVDNVSETVANAMLCHSCADISETVVKVFRAKAVRTYRANQTGRLRLRLALS